MDKQVKHLYKNTNENHKAKLMDDVKAYNYTNASKHKAGHADNELLKTCLEISFQW